MIPVLKVNEDFFKEIPEDSLEWWKQMSEPIMFIDGIPIYNMQNESFVGDGWMFDEYQKAELDIFGYCPSEWALSNISLIPKHSDRNFMVLASLVDESVAESDDSYGSFYYTDDGASTDMSYSDYVDEYGHPETQYMNSVVRFEIYLLKEKE